jgi:hypothetical protein
MSKNKKNGKNTEVKVQDKTKDGNGKDSIEAARKALEALPEDQRAAVLKDMGFTQRKAREKKDKGPDTRELFDAATEKIGEMAVPICNLLSEFPGAVAVTFERNPEGVFSANVKRVRNKYGPRKSKSD